MPRRQGTQLQLQSKAIVEKNENFLICSHMTQQSCVSKSSENTLKISVKDQEYFIKTDLKKPAKLGLMMVGWGGNNGSTLTASLLANKKGLSWATRTGTQSANFFGSMLMASTTSIGCDEEGQEVFIPLNELVPIVHPDDLVIGGWDISKLDLGSAMKRSKVLEPDLIRQLESEMVEMQPLPSIYHPDFIALNQFDRADNLITGTKQVQLDTIRSHIRSFKKKHDLQSVIVLWTANTERYTRLDTAIHFNSNDLLAAIHRNHDEISPSSMFAAAAILEDCPFINGSPQNTFVPAVIELAKECNVPIGGDDFKSGQTKLKSVLVDFLIQSGIKPLSIVSYNHLGNNDGKNLAEKPQFSSKELSKRGVVEDMVASNPILYSARGKEQKMHGPDHVVIIEYVPAVGDSKRALDEYENEIFMGGRNTISIHNTCEDSLLAAPLMLDLVLLMEFLSRVQVALPDMKFSSLHPVCSLLSFMLKAPLVPENAPVVNALMSQRRAIETMLKACIGLPAKDDLNLIQRLQKKN